MNENKKALDREQKEQRAIYIENKILSFLLPITGIVALILGVMGLILTINAGQIGITVFYIVLSLIGFLGAIYGIVLLIRLKKPDFLKRKKKEEMEDSILQD